MIGRYGVFVTAMACAWFMFSCATTKSLNSQLTQENRCTSENISTPAGGDNTSSFDKAASEKSDSVAAPHKFSRELLVGKTKRKPTNPSKVSIPNETDPAESWTESSKHIKGYDNYPDRDISKEPDWIEEPSNAKELLKLILILAGVSAVYFGIFKNLKNFTE